jgi:peptide/nickel transport system substrate-binding protein
MGIAGVANNLVQESLIGIEWDGRPGSRLATRWEWSPDRMSIRLELDKGIKFHDGTGLTAATAADILREGLTRNEATAISFQSVTSVEADGDSLVVRFSKPDAFFLADLANVALMHPLKDWLGTGPFKYAGSDDELANIRALDSIRLMAFDEYYRGRPHISAVELKRYDDQRGAWAALMRGEIDAVHEVSPSAMDFVEKQSTIRTFPHTRPYYVQVLFNLRHPALKETAVRQALSHAVDRQQIVDSGLDERGLVAEGPIWPQHWAYSAAPKSYSLNTEAATLLLDGAGYRIKLARQRGRMNSRFRFTCLTLANDSRYEKIGILLQKQLYDIGVDMEIVALPWEQLVARIGKRDFDAFLFERTSGRSLTWTYLAFHSSQSTTGYTAADRVLDRLRGATNDAETRAAVNDLQRRLYDDPPALFLAWPVVARAVSRDFEVPTEAGRDVMGSLWQWRPAAAPRP